MNGEFKDSLVNNFVSSQNGSAATSLGVNRTKDGNNFEGAIDELKIFDCALTDSEI
ncbi:MAG: hypothetical protein JKY52_02005 [Flavobacteriales bacterium]|nr:hypothetical protein [Flavobacteriales bacterium]